MFGCTARHDPTSLWKRMLPGSGVCASYSRRHVGAAPPGIAHAVDGEVVHLCCRDPLPIKGVCTIIRRTVEVPSWPFDVVWIGLDRLDGQRIELADHHASGGRVREGAQELFAKQRELGLDRVDPQVQTVLRVVPEAVDRPLHPRVGSGGAHPTAQHEVRALFDDRIGQRVRAVRLIGIQQELAGDRGRRFTGGSACRGDPARRRAVWSSATSSTRVGTVSQARTQTRANPALLTGTRSIGSDGFLSGRGSGAVGKNWAGDLAGIGILPAGRVHPHGPVMPEYCACLPER